MAKQFTALMDSEKPVVDQVDKFRRMMTGESDANSQRDPAPETPGTLSMSPSTLMDLVAALEQHKAQSIDQARASDATITGTE